MRSARISSVFVLLAVTVLFVTTASPAIASPPVQETLAGRWEMQKGQAFASYENALAELEQRAESEGAVIELLGPPRLEHNNFPSHCYRYVVDYLYIR
jgi:hypothetical protein